MDISLIYCNSFSKSQLQLISCVVATTTEATSRSTFLTSTNRHSFINSIPRGGADDGDSSSTTPDMSSLLSGMNLGPNGLPDMSNPPTPQQLQQSMEQFTSLLSSPQFKEMMNDPTKMEAQLETMRTSLLNTLTEMEKGDNPMMTMMLNQMKTQLAQSFPGGWDGVKELIEDKTKWKEMCNGLIDVMKNLSDDDLKNIMGQMGGAAGMGGMGGGMPGMGGFGGDSSFGDAFGGDVSGTLAGLDDLSEGED